MVHLGAILGHPMAIFGHPGAMLGGLEGDLGPPGSHLWTSRGHLGATLHRKACELDNVDFTLISYAFLWPGSNLGAMLGGLNGDLGPPGAHLGTSCGHL